jgi:hypothetical protein
MAKADPVPIVVLAPRIKSPDPMIFISLLAVIVIEVPKITLLAVPESIVKPSDETKEMEDADLKTKFVSLPAFFQ